MQRRGTKFFTITPTVTASSAYTDGDVVGSLFEIPGAVLDEGGVAVVKSIFSRSKSKVNSNFGLVLFDSKPAGTFTNKTAFNPSNADLAKIAALADFGTNWRDFANNSVDPTLDPAVLIQSVRDPANPLNKTSLWGLIYCNGSTPTFGTTDDMAVTIGFEHF